MPKFKTSAMLGSLIWPCHQMHAPEGHSDESAVHHPRSIPMASSSACPPNTGVPDKIWARSAPFVVWLSAEAVQGSSRCPVSKRRRLGRCGLCNMYSCCTLFS